MQEKLISEYTEVSTDFAERYHMPPGWESWDEMRYIKFIFEPKGRYFQRDFLITEEVEKGHIISIPKLGRCLGLLFILENEGLVFWGMHAIPLRCDNQELKNYFYAQTEKFIAHTKILKVIIAGGLRDCPENIDTYERSLEHYVQPVKEALQKTDAEIIRIIPNKNTLFTVLFANRKWFRVFQYQKDSFKIEKDSAEFLRDRAPILEVHNSFIETPR